MKKIFLALMLSVYAIFGVVAQSDLTSLAVVKLNKPETITLKQLKTRVDLYKKQNNVAQFTVEQKKNVLESMIDEKLILQAAQKEGITITDSAVDQQYSMLLSQQIGRPVTETEFAAFVKANAGIEYEAFMKQQVGMSVSEYKSYLKNSLIINQYVMMKSKDKISAAVATDAEIRSYYELNKPTFVQNDMVKIFLTLVPKQGNDAAAAKAKAEKLLKQLTDKSVTTETIKANAEKDPSYTAGDLMISKTQMYAQQLGISYNDLMELFSYNIGYVSKLNETPTDFQFYVVRAKYDAKMLGLSDLVQPETTTTIYDFIKIQITQQKQNQALLLAVNDISKSLNTAENVDRKKTGDALDKLMNW